MALMTANGHLIPSFPAFLGTCRDGHLSSASSHSVNFHNLRTGYPQLQNAPKLSGTSAASDIPHATSSSAQKYAAPRGERMRTTITMSVATTVAETAAPADPLGSDFCGPSGTVLSRPPVPGGGQDAAGKLYHIHTFGCQMNLADSERMAGVLEELGYNHTESANDANLVVYNTCSIRDKSEHKVYTALGLQARRKRADPSLRLVVAGCVAQQEGATLLRRVPEVDLVMGPQHANRLGELLEQVEQGSQVVATDPIHIVEDITLPKRDSQVSAWVNVIYGCNERCTYCVVPGVRGEEQSREPDAIRREMLALGEAGYKEVTLLGQNIDAYGRDLGGSASDGSGRRQWTLTDLLRYVHDVPGIERIRFVTSHPRYFTERLIRACAELPKVCKYFNIPFQSGDDDILKEMGRGYSAKQYRHLIGLLRSYMPDAAISADCIVGFPGESEEQFQRSLDLLEDIRFDSVNTAAYSPRPNTPAALWTNQVADLVKMDRLHRINRLVLDHSLARNQRYLGRTEHVLVEGLNPKQKGQVMGRLDTNRLTFFDGGADLIGKIVPVLITDVRSMTLTGRQASI